MQFLGVAQGDTLSCSILFDFYIDGLVQLVYEQVPRPATAGASKDCCLALCRRLHWLRNRTSTPAEAH